MASLQLLAHSRGYLRASLRKIYNDRNKFIDYSFVARQTLKAKILDLSNQILKADKEILADEMMEDEVGGSKLYKDRIRKCLVTIDMCNEPSAQSINVARSLLKNRIAPLPKFESLESENLELFLTNFEHALYKFNYTNYDRLLLLKQQVTGKAAFLL